ncbi:LPXTG-motif cell wall anchor domain protein [Streptococcus mitis]|uniref:LPXTG-motif cell wall anchor domain protein n=1 Tax=Streptococcus mitis TaxID=28037 RepID=A0A081QCF9_STRMT|nr:YSIRK signal domain/LPXTG anchor domain surface protein [Streptococcus mitis]KEQ40632.1 LPXTG-motif cell wall anchor domain protein [Streptococcus mitis]
MYKARRQVNRKSFDWYGLSQRFSIRKYHFGAASVLLGTALILGLPQASAKADDAVSANTALTSTGQGVDEGTNSATDGLKNVTLPPTATTTEVAVLEKPTLSAEEIAKQAAASETPAVTSTSETAKEESKPATSDAVVKTNTEENTVTESNKKKEEVAPKHSRRSKRALSEEETPDHSGTDYSGAKISGRLNDGKTQYVVGEQILGSYNLDISAPTKIEEGGYILITASDNEPLDAFEIGSSLRFEKVNNNQYKLYTGELSGGAYANINVSYKLKKFETGKDSHTTIKAELFDKNNTLIKSTNFSNTNTTGTPYISVDTRNGIRRQTLLETNQQETEVDVSKSKDLQLSLKSTNKEAAAITKIDHAVELPAGVTIAQTSLDEGWRLENGVAKYTRLVPSSTTMFASGDNTQNELLYLNVSNGGTPAEFLTGKKLTFKDNATYTDKSGFTNTTSDDVTVTVRAVNPKKSIGGSNSGSGSNPNNDPTNSGGNNSGTGGSTVPTKSDVPVAIFNTTMEDNKSRVVNIAMPYINAKTEDTRIIQLSGDYGDSYGPANLKEAEISIDSNIDQNRAIEFYAIWTPTDKGKSTFVSYQDNPESLGLNSTLTFEVYSVTNGTESKIGEVSLRKGDVADKVALPDGTTTVKLKPKGNMPLETAGLQGVGLFLSQDLKGLEEAKKLAKEGNKVESIVTASVYTYGYDEPKVAVSKTTFAYSRDAIKLVPTTNPITTTLAGNLTQVLDSKFEVYEYSPNGLGNRIYNNQTWDRKTYVDLQNIAAKNAKLLVELPDGFSYAGNDSSVKTVENYNNSGKTVLEVTPRGQNSKYTLSPDLQFVVDNWVASGTYPIKYTLVWNEDERVVGINPNNDYDGTNANITNTSTFTYELPVINNSATRLIAQVTDQPTDSSTYSTGAYNLAPNDEVKYRLSLTNSSNAATGNNVVISTLPRVSDKNIVLNSKDRGSQFDVHMTAAATTPEGWTAYYSTTPVSGTAVELEKAITLTADQITDWSTVTAVKFVSNQNASLRAGSTAAFYLPAKVSSTATNNQVAVLTSATRTDGQDTFNETNPVRISVKIEDVKKGAVKVAYENKDNVSIKDTVTAIESRAYKKGYDVDTKEYKPNTLIGKDEKEYYFVKVKDSSPSPTGTIDSPEVTVTYVYDLLYDEITKATKQTVTYEGAGENTPATNEQTDYTFIRKTNKVTNVTTWNEETHTYGVVTTPKVEGYYADKAQAGGKEVTPTNPEASDTVVYKPLGKVILVDEGGNEIPNTPKPTYRNNPNDPTVGGETPIPEIPEGYEIKPKQVVPGFNPEGKVVTPPKPGEDTRIVLVAKQEDITKATKQTVTYEGAGTSTPTPNEQTDYTFTGKTNKVTNVTTWNEETHTYGVVTTPKVEGYYADKAQAGGKEVTPTNPEASDTVVYKPLGKVILVDEGGNEIPNTPKPTYRNNPNDPTVGGETPIPEIPEGYEIKPKQVVPGFNSTGKVVTPPKPGEDTRIVLVEVNQKATVTYVVEGTNTVLHTDKLEGKSGEPINYTTATKLAELKGLGYELVTDGFVTATDKNFDKDSKVDQNFVVTVAKTVPVTPTTPQNPNEDPQNPKPGDPIDPKNPNGSKWTKDALDKLNNIKSVTRTITYIKDGTTEEVSPTEAPKVTNKVSFIRTVVVNPKDGSVVGYDTTGDGIADVAATDTRSGWKAAGTTKFAEKTSPVVKGYVVKPNQDTQGDLVEADGSKVKASTTDLTVDSPNQDLKVRYVPVGKLVPKVPEGVTPPTPTPYENNPKDPGKVVPPSSTKPKDPKDPSKGYEVPDVPKDPTKDTPISYVPVTPERKTPKQTPVVPVQPEGPNEQSESNTPKYADGQNELPNTGTKDHADLATLGLLGALSGFGLVARKKREDEK